MVKEYQLDSSLPDGEYSLDDDFGWDYDEDEPENSDSDIDAYLLE